MPGVRTNIGKGVGVVTKLIYELETDSTVVSYYALGSQRESSEKAKEDAEFLEKKESIEVFLRKVALNWRDM